VLLKQEKIDWRSHFRLSPAGESQMKALVAKAKALGFQHPMTDAQLDALAPCLSPDVRNSFESSARKTGQPIEVMRRSFLRILFENEAKPGGALASPRPA